ncbi:MAG: hypothetical protein VYD54_07090 [Bdellovibrionota bacterium]|nr:hypothetical protein [Bdellovibrionota bacterium]
MKINLLNMANLFCLLMLFSCSFFRKTAPPKAPKKVTGVLYHTIQDKAARSFYQKYSLMLLNQERAVELLKNSKKSPLKLYGLAYKLKKDQRLIFEVFNKYENALSNYQKKASPSSVRQILICLAARNLLNKNGKFLKAFDKKKDHISKSFPKLEKSLDLYESLKLKIKYNLLSKESLSNKDKGLKIVKRELKKHPDWFLRDPVISYLNTNINLKMPLLGETESLFSPVSSKGKFSLLRERIHHLGKKVGKLSFKKGLCSEMANSFEKDFCRVDFYMSLFLKSQENGLVLISYLNEINKRGEQISGSALRAYYEHSDNELKLEKHLKKIQRDNLKKIKKVKIHDVITEESYLRLLFSASNLSLLHFQYTSMGKLNDQIARQRKQFELNDSNYARMKYDLFKMEKKLKGLNNFFKKEAFSSFSSISKKRNSKANLEQVFYLNIINQTLRQRTKSHKTSEFIAERGQYLSFLRKKLGEHIFNVRGRPELFLTSLLNEKRKMTNDKVSKEKTLPKMGPLDIVLGRYSNRLLNSNFQGHWDVVGIFLGSKKHLEKLGLNKEKGPHFWLKKKIINKENLLTIINNKAKIIPLKSFLKNLTDIMVVRPKKFKKLQWLKVTSLEGKHYKASFDILNQGKGLSGKLIKDAFPYLNLRKKINFRSRWIFPRQIAKEVGPKGPLIPLLISLNGQSIKGKTEDLSRVSKCLLQFYCQNDLLEKIKKGEEYSSWLLSKLGGEL